MSDTPGRAPTTSLIADAMAQMARLVETEVRLVRTELSEKVGQAVRAIVVIVVSAVLLLAALFLLLLGVVNLLIAEFMMRPFVAYFTVGGVLIVIGALAAYISLQRLKPAGLAPQRSMNQLGKDAQVIKEQVS